MIYCLSGGAKGSDSLFALIGKESNLYTTLAYTFIGHITYGGIRIELSDSDLYKYMDTYKKICLLMNREVSIKSYIQKLILRDFYQIYGRYGNKSELVIAIGEIERKTVNIKGGTGYAIRIAMMNKIPIILIDKKDNYSYKTFDYRIGNWRELYEIEFDKFKIEKGFTGIGNRDIDIVKARKSIIYLLNKILHC